MCNLVMEGWGAEEGQPIVGPGCSITHIEQDGIGRPGPRNPAATEVDECLQQSTDTGECAQCVCSSCGGLIAACAAIPDCKAIMDCALGLVGLDWGTFDTACADVVTAHASAYGMAMQFTSCFVPCNVTCMAPADAGVADGG